MLADPIPDAARGAANILREQTTEHDGMSSVRCH